MCYKDHNPAICKTAHDNLAPKQFRFSSHYLLRPANLSITTPSVIFLPLSMHDHGVIYDCMYLHHNDFRSYIFQPIVVTHCFSIGDDYFFIHAKGPLIYA